MADVPLESGFSVTLRLGFEKGRPVVLEACFKSSDNRPIPQRVYRKLPQTEVVREASEFIERLRRGELPFPPELEPPLLDPGSPNPGPPRTTDLASLAKLAQMYVEELERNPRSPNKALAERMGYTDSHIRNLISTARQHGLLTRATPGKAGGELTPKGREWLERAQ